MAEAEADLADPPEEDEGDRDDTVAEVELALYQVSVRVKGRSDDELEEVEDTAERLIDHLVDRAEALEDAPDDRGLG